MTNIRECKFCGKLIDFDQPWCDHETMEESAWLDIRKRLRNVVIDKVVEQAAKDLIKL